MAREITRSESDRMATVYICAVWMVKAKRFDKESIRFWCQTLGCPTQLMTLAILQAQKIQAGSWRDQCTDGLMQLIWNEIKDFSADECKLLLKSSREAEHDA